MTYPTLKQINTRIVDENLGLREDIEQAEATVKRLTCCILCDHCSGVDDSRWCDEEEPWDETVSWYDSCHYTPSRFTEVKP